jgi:CRISPR/Cas system-associated exonuclease Cas4 (RecB family)
VQYKVRLDNSSPSAIKKNKDIVAFLRDFSFSPTALDTYLNCQLQFYYRHVLTVGKKEDFSGDIERTDIGKFVHTVLSQFFSRKKNHVLKPVDLSVKILHRIIESLFSEHYGKNISGALYLLKKQIKDHLRSLLQNYYIPLAKREPLIVLGTEHSIRLRKNSFYLKGRLDSIEKRSDKTFIVDFKTGSSAEYLKIRFDRLDPERRGTWDDAIGSLQLPFYLLLYNQETGTPLQNLQGIFLLIGQSAITERSEHRLFENGNHAEIFAILEKIIFRLLEEIVDPSIPFMPVRDTKGTCPLCDYQYICGTQWIEKPFSFA